MFVQAAYNTQHQQVAVVDLVKSGTWQHACIAGGAKTKMGYRVQASYYSALEQQASCNPQCAICLYSCDVWHKHPPRGPTRTKASTHPAATAAAAARTCIAGVAFVLFLVRFVVGAEQRVALGVVKSASASSFP